jgi:two-component system response regulator AtoC
LSRSIARHPESLLESELFATTRRLHRGRPQATGRFELAAGGTIFLDEIAEIPVSLQAKLLQVIEHKQFCRLGDTKTRTVNARIIAATNGPLESMIAKGQFRADLFYRLNDYRITLPPLRERKEDIPLLVAHFIGKYNLSFDAKDLSISSSTMKQLVEYAWPGNVRELESIIRRFSLTGNENTIWESLSGNQMPLPPSARPPLFAPPTSNAPLPAISRLDEIVLAAERQAITDALEQTGWNQRHAADLLGVSYSTCDALIEMRIVRSAQTQFFKGQ